MNFKSLEKSLEERSENDFIEKGKTWEKQKLSSTQIISIYIHCDKRVQIVKEKI